jgi:hypothetical protein
MTTALALVILAATGCGSDDKPAQLHPLSLKEQSYSITKSRDGYVVNWAGVLANANRWHFGENTVALISAVDAQGKQVVNMEQPLDAIPPAASLAFTGEATASTEPTQVKIGYKSATWHEAARIPSAFKPFPITQMATEKLETGSYLITGYVSDPFQKAAGSLVVTALLRDDKGKLVGGGSAFVDDVRTGTNRRFIITAEGVRGRVAETETFARTWGSTAKPYEDLALGGAIPINTVKPTVEPFVKDRGYLTPTDRRP